MEDRSHTQSTHTYTAPIEYVCAGASLRYLVGNLWGHLDKGLDLPRSEHFNAVVSSVNSVSLLWGEFGAEA